MQITGTTADLSLDKGVHFRQSARVIEPPGTAFLRAVGRLALVLGAVGWTLAALFVLVFPANVYQAIAATSAFGLDTDAARWGRLLFQPVLVVWALWSSGAWAPRGAREG